MPTLDELSRAESQDVGGLPISSTLTKTPALPTPAAQEGPSKMLEGFASALASFGDAFRQFGGKPAVFQKERREATEATRKGEHEKLLVESEQRKAKAAEQTALTGERDYRLRVLEFTRKNSADEVKAAQDYLTFAEKLHTQGLDPQVVENALTGMADRTGLAFLKDLAPDLAKDKTFALTAAGAFSILKDDPGGRGGLFLANARSLRAKDPEKFRTELAHTAAHVALNTISQKLPGVVAYLKGLKGEQPITTEDVAGFLGEQNPVYGQIVRGGWDAPTEVRTQLEKLLASNGVQTPAVGAKVAEEEATRPGKVKTAVEVAKGTEEATRPGRVQTAQEIAKATEQSKIRIAAAQGREAALVKLEIPEKASPAERAHLTDELTTLGRLSELETLYDQRFVGMVTGRAAGLMEATGLGSAKQAAFRSSLSTFRNRIIKEIAGANVPVSEEKRMMAELPEEKNPSHVFEARLEQSKRNVLILHQKRREVLGKTGVDLSNLPPVGFGIFAPGSGASGKSRPKVLKIEKND